MAPATFSTRPRILYLDAYDSFSNNIIAQAEQCLDADIVKCYIDSDFNTANCDGSEPPAVTGFESEAELKEDKIPKFSDFVKGFDAVIAGPGPGWAKCDKDVGLMKELWKLQDADLIPVLGICLGFQSMCLAFGADITNLNEPRHGLVSEILHNGRSIFQGVEQLLATQYHSLQVFIDHRMQTKKAVRYPAELWEPSETNPDLEPLAWDFDNKYNGAVLMAAKHTYKPFWGMQFHPESICTNSEGTRIIRNWWNDAQMWKRKRRLSYGVAKNSLSSTRSGSMTIEDIRTFFSQGMPRVESSYTLSRDETTRAARVLNTSKDNAAKGFKSLEPEELASLLINGDAESPNRVPPLAVQCTTVGSGRLTVADVVELFDMPRADAIVLESGLQSNLLPMAVGTGRHSIVGLVIPGETIRIHYYAGSRMMQIRDGNDNILWEWFESDPWQLIRKSMTNLHERLQEPPKATTWAPFWGGLMGYASYEAGLETIEVQPGDKAAYPDICFAYITRSVVFDHQLKKIYVQSIRGMNDKAWVSDAVERIWEAAGRKSRESSPNPTPMPRPNPFEQNDMLNTYLASCEQFVANRSEYCTSVASCQSYIADGQSYELCLTTANQIRARRPRACRLSKAENNELSWKVYKRLASQNPAPFGAYMRMHNVHILSSSPERYISWDRSQSAQCRPIKGTVAKKSGVTAADAHAILSSPKERAENLMIVDLVRHQLHGVYGSGNVHVSQLMQIEEYETLWQLVSVIDAIPRGLQKPKTPDEWEDPNPSDYVAVSKTSEKPKDYLGFDAFVESLPAGSMTGAPKKRSCELLQREEGNRRRGIYSGVLGYLDIGGGGDFSVVIRTAVKVDDPSKSNTATEDVWTIGAGGAITAQSEPQAEYDEMLGKFQSTARAFKPMPPAPRILDDEQRRKLEAFSRISAAIHGDASSELGEGDVEDEDGDVEVEVEGATPLLETLESLQAQLMMLQRLNGLTRE